MSQTPTLACTIFAAPYRWAVKGTRRELSWEHLLRAAQKPELWPGEATIAESEGRLPGFCLALLRDDTRVLGGGSLEAERETEQRVEAVGGIIVEYLDDPLVDEAHLRRWWKGYAFVAYTTAYHQRALGERPPGPRWRVVLRLARPVPLEVARRVGQWAQHARRGAGSVSDAVLRPAHVVALPAVVPGGYAFAVGEGRAIDPEAVEAELVHWSEEGRQREAARAVSGITLSDAVASYRRRLADASRRALMPWPGDIRSLPADGVEHTVSELLHQARVSAVALPGLGQLAGSLWPGRLAVLVGGSGSGRTALALQLAEAVARAGHPVLYASADLPVDQVIARLMVVRAATGGLDVPASHAAVGQGCGDASELDAAAEALIEVLPSLFVWNPTTPERTDEGLRTRALGVAASCGGRAPLVIVDPVEGFEDGHALEAAYRELSAACRDLVRPGSLGVDWPGAAVLAVVGVPAGLRDPLATAERLGLAGAKPADRARLRERLALDIGGLGTDAALVLALARDAVSSAGVGDALVVVAKNRHGHTGSVKLRFLGAAGVFFELEEPG